MRVLITGATGLLGSHVAERLRADGADVVALVREESRVSYLESLGIELQAGDVTRRESLLESARGCEALVHCAAIVVSRAPWDAYRRVNIEGTANALSAAAEAGVSRAVHVSSVAVYGGPEAVGRAPVTEEDPLDVPLAPGEYYARSKREADAVARVFQRRSDLEVVVLRPALLYGERDRVAMPRFLQLFRLPAVPLVGRGRAELPLVYAGNAAGAVSQALFSQRAAGHTYNLATDFPINQRRFFSLIERALSRRRLYVPIPYSFLNALARGMEVATSLVSDRPPFLNRRNVSFMGAGNPFDSSRAREVLGFDPRIPHEEGVARAVRWFKSGS